MATRVAPSSAKRSAIARPIPREPPVTRTDWPSKFMSVGSTELTRSGGAGFAGAGSGHSSWQRLVRGGGARHLAPARAVARDARALVRLRGRVAEPVAQLDLLLRIEAHVVVFR